MSDEQQEQENPLIQRFKSVLPKLVESGLFSKLVLSTFHTHVTGRLKSAAVFGEYKDELSARRGTPTSHIDLEAIGAATETDLLPYLPDANSDHREAAALPGMVLLLTWAEEESDAPDPLDLLKAAIHSGKSRPPNDMEYDELVFHFLETLYEAS